MTDSPVPRETLQALIADILVCAREIEGDEETTDCAASIIASCQKAEALLSLPVAAPQTQDTLAMYPDGSCISCGRDSSEHLCPSATDNNEQE